MLIEKFQLNANFHRCWSTLYRISMQILFDRQQEQHGTETACRLPLTKSRIISMSVRSAPTQRGAHSHMCANVISSLNCLIDLYPLLSAIAVHWSCHPIMRKGRKHFTGNYSGSSRIHPLCFLELFLSCHDHLEIGRRKSSTTDVHQTRDLRNSPQDNQSYRVHGLLNCFLFILDLIWVNVV